jgi:hypothetical protein
VIFRRADLSSVFRPKASTVFSSEQLLAAEDRLPTASIGRNGLTVPLTLVEQAARKEDREGHLLSRDQERAIAKIGDFDRILVGPAGTGKTTTMSALRRAWERLHGTGSVIGLAPTAAAADVLAGDLGISTENTAKWVHEHRNVTRNLTSGQLVIIDEASLAGTLLLDTIITHAQQAGAKVLLVGGWAQLAAVDVDGAFGMLVRDRTDAPELTDVRRFRTEWEKHASLGLRIGDTDVIDTYLDHDRIDPGGHEVILEQVYQAWRADQADRKASVLIAETIDTVSELNTRAGTDRIPAGDVANVGGRSREPDGLLGLLHLERLRRRLAVGAQTRRAGSGPGRRRVASHQDCSPRALRLATSLAPSR